MKCQQCGRENRTKADFCAWCGAGLPEEPSVPALSVPEQPSADKAPKPTESSAPQPLSGPAASAAPAKSSAQVDATPSKAEPGPPYAAMAAPLRVGTVVAERYEISELLESAPDHNSYRAQDLAACTACGYEQNKLDEAGHAPGYCEACGAALNRPRSVTLVEREQNLPAKYDLRFAEGERDYFVTVDRTEPPRTLASDDQELRLVWGRATDKGVRREQNEDYIETWFYTSGGGRRGESLRLGLFVVADGLGGHEAGEVASRLATDVIWQVLRDDVWEPLVRTPSMAQPPTPTPGAAKPGGGPETGAPGMLVTRKLGSGPEESAAEVDWVDAKLAGAVARANKSVYDARIARANDMSTTVTLALVVNGLAHIANVGDSRAYVWNAGGLRRLTKDHSLVQRLVDDGQITREEVYSHPQRNLIYKSIGDRPEVQADIVHHTLANDDRLVLCSDGLWEMVHDDGLEEVLLSEPDVQRASDRLVANANLAGGDDNISVIIVQAVKG